MGERLRSLRLTDIAGAIELIDSEMPKFARVARWLARVAGAFKICCTLCNFDAVVACQGLIACKFWWQPRPRDGFSLSLFRGKFLIQLKQKF